MECLVMLKGVPESGRSDELASDTGTPRCVASRVSAQPLTAIASVRIDARVTCTRFTALLEIDGARLVPARPKGSGFKYACEPALQTHRQPQPDVGSDPQYAMRAVIELLRIVGDMDPHHSEAEVAPDHPAEVGLVILSARWNIRHLVVPDARRKVRFDADPRRGQRHAEADGAQHGGRRRHGVGARCTLGVMPRAHLKIHRDGDQAAADEPERRGRAVRGRPGVLALGLPRGDASGQGDGPDPERGAAAECMALASAVVWR